MVLKTAGGHRFSLLVFGFSQVLIDIEPLVRIIRGEPILHGFTHTLAGATIIGGVAAALGRPIANAFLSALSGSPGTKESRSGISWRSALVSSLVGTFSHLILDGVMHRDMHPFAPLTDANPLLGVVSLGTLHAFCIVAGVVGLSAMGLKATYARVLARKSRRGVEDHALP